MRCKCCNEDNAEFILDDWYCSDCSSAIYEVISEDEEDYRYSEDERPEGQTVPLNSKAV